ncbi:MAG: DNA primase [Cyanobacteria bacterium SZAS LIN-2]|nr:DNA primase [Cyanobacteria bacterium SZAS LIN-2]
MTSVTKEVIAEVRMQASILEVVSETVVLKRAGANYRGLCPFHAEKSPSFNVTPEKGIYKCFGCGEGGDVFAFVQKVKGINFIDAVRELAHKYGVKLAESHEDRKEYDRRSQILLLYQQAAEYYMRLLQDPHEGIVGRKYLADRGLSQETIEKFKLGYAPNAWDGLLTYLTDKAKASPATLEEAGLVRKRAETSGHYDLYRNRLMIPICDSEGRVIAFGGRTLGDDQVKYINSPETPIYTKGQHLFGFNLAKTAIKEKDSVIVVEGYFDAITSHQYGYTNTVAVLGTALTEPQAKLLVRYTESKRVYLSFDADAAGVKAVESGLKTLSQIAEGIGIELRVIKVPGGKDPDECLRSGPEGVEAFERAKNNAALMIDYQLDKAVSGIDLETRTGRIEAASKIVPILAVIKNSVARGEYVRLWAMQLRLREEEILSDVSQYRAANRIDSRPSPGAFRSEQGQGQSGYQSGYNRPGGGFNRQEGGGFKREGGPGQFGGGGGFNRGGGQFGEGGQGQNPSNIPQKAQFTKNTGGKFQKGGKGQWGPKKPEFADEEGLPMPASAMGHVGNRRAPISGCFEAERQLLALYLTSREDYDVAARQLADDRLLNDFHQRIKEAIEGVGPNFATIEDLQSQLQDRLAPDAEAARHLIDIILKAEEFKKQKMPVSVVLLDSRARILKERLTLLKTAISGLMSRADNDSEAMALQSRIVELTQLDTVVLSKVETLEDLEKAKARLDAIESAQSQTTKMETHV